MKHRLALVMFCLAALAVTLVMLGIMSIGQAPQIPTQMALPTVCVTVDLGQYVPGQGAPDGEPLEYDTPAVVPTLCR